MSNEYTYQHGKYNFCINLKYIDNQKLKNDLSKAVGKQFGSFFRSKEPPLLTFFLTESLHKYFPSDSFINIGSIRFTNKALWYAKDGLEFIYTKDKNRHSLYVKVVSNNSWKSNCRFLNKSFSNSAEKQISILYYRIFLVFSQLVNIELETTYIHGATVADEKGDATLFPADSGVGKSSMLFRMAKEGIFSYIADDLSIVSSNGECFYAGRSISTKPYHLKNFPFLNELIEQKMPRLQKLQWEILKDNRLVYGIDPQELFNGKIKKSAKIKTVVHLINTSENGFSIEKSDPITLAEASANILMNELMLGYQILYRSLAIPGNTLFTSPGVIYERALKAYIDLFKNCDLYLLKVPYMSHPDLMYDFLVQQKIMK